MRRKQIDIFFEALDRELGLRAEIILVGASAGTLMGHVRPSVDIDFEIRPAAKASDPSLQLQLEEAVRKISRILGVAVNYSGDIAGWSMVSFLNYRKTAIPYRKIGRLNVKLIAPEYWTIGKMARFVELDVIDILKIIKIKKISATRQIRVWASVIKDSRLSLELGDYRKHVEYFLKHYGRRAWGKDFNAQKALARFHKQAHLI